MLLWNGDRWLVEVRDRARARARAGAEVIAGAARAEAPVLTGELRDSVHVEEVRGDGRYVGYRVVATAPHAVYVVRGTARHPMPNDFLGRAVQATRSEVASILRGGH